MRRNEGNVDRGVRAVIGVVAAAVAVAVGPASVLGVVLLVIAAIMLVTAAVGVCPLYSLFGVSTCPVDGD
jgi:hypothetical protein